MMAEAVPKRRERPTTPRLSNAREGCCLGGPLQVRFAATGSIAQSVELRTFNP
jgi:hypothetical protein